MKFDKVGADAAIKYSSSGMTELLGMTNEEKKSICIEMLNEFGASNIQEKGDELIHSCCLPFGLHKNGDRNPSASLNWKKMVFHCHGCDNSGSLMWFIAVCRGEEVGESRKWITRRVDVESPESIQSLLKFIDSFYDPKSEVTPPMPHFNPSVLDDWLFIHPYLTELRKIPEANIKHFRVGFNPKEDRIVLPHFWHDALVGWQTRRLMNDGSPKYKNTPDFPKRETLFNLSKNPIVVESVMSVVSKYHLAPNLCSTFGASVTKKQINLLTDNSQVTLWFDNDKPGWEATKKVGAALIGYTEVYVINSEWAADPADLTDEEFIREVEENKIPFSLWHPPSQLKEANMLKKYGTGKVLDEDQKDVSKEAAKTWTEEDQKELQEENEQ